MSTKVKENISKIKNDLPLSVNLIAVSKTHTIELINEAYAAGQRLFAENKVQELVAKWEQLPKDIEWHYIGHLQTNKVKYLAPFVSLIHGVDSLNLLQAINKEAVKNNRVIKCLVQIHIAQEQTKFGMNYDEATLFFKQKEYDQLKNVEISGLMGMATFTDNTAQIEKEFADLSAFFTEVKRNYFNENPNFKELSMGMSDDYMLAIKHGSTMIRVGSAIFGDRHYQTL